MPEIKGTLRRDPEMRYTPLGKAVVNFDIQSYEWTDEEALEAQLVDDLHRIAGALERMVAADEHPKRAPRGRPRPNAARREEHH